MPRQPPIAALATINRTLEAAGYPKTDGTIQRRLEQALAERGKDPGLGPRFHAYILDRRSQIEWLTANMSPAQRAARLDELATLEEFIKRTLTS